MTAEDTGLQFFCPAAKLDHYISTYYFTQLIDQSNVILVTVIVAETLTDVIIAKWMECFIQIQYLRNILYLNLYPFRQVRKMGCAV